MKIKDVVGKRIKSVYQDRTWDDENRRHVWNVVCFILEDGTLVTFNALELTDGYAVEINTGKPK